MGDQWPWQTHTEQSRTISNGTVILPFTSLRCNSMRVSPRRTSTGAWAHRRYHHTPRHAGINRGTNVYVCCSSINPAGQFGSDKRDLITKLWLRLAPHALTNSPWICVTVFSRSKIVTNMVLIYCIFKVSFCSQIYKEQTAKPRLTERLFRATVRVYMQLVLAKSSSNGRSLV